MEKFKTKNRQELFKTISSLGLILFAFFINGFLALIPVGFSFDKMLTVAYWADFTVLFGSEILVLYGMYLIQKVKDLKADKITKLQDDIMASRQKVYDADKVADAEDWLREILNYKQRLVAFEHKIMSVYDNLYIKEPAKFVTKKCFNWIRKIKHNKKERTYNALVAIRNDCRTQLDFIRKDKLKLALLVKKHRTIEEQVMLDTLIAELDTQEYEINNARIKYDWVYWGTLIADCEEEKSKQDTPLFREKKELSKNIVKYLGTGLIVTAVISSLVFPSLNGLDYNTIVIMAIRLAALLLFIVRGVELSNKLILGTYYKALENRKSIYSQMHKDLGISNIIVEDQLEAIADKVAKRFEIVEG